MFIQALPALHMQSTCSQYYETIEVFRNEIQLVCQKKELNVEVIQEFRNKNYFYKNCLNSYFWIHRYRNKDHFNI